MELPKQVNLNDVWRSLSQEANLNELWKALGRPTRRTPEHEWFGRLTLFGAGLMIGAGLALLLTARDEEDPAQATSAAAEDLH
jgi:hypothetical protein